MKVLITGIRSLCFYIGYAALTGWFTITGLLFFSFTPLAVRGRYLINWNRLVLAWLRLTCGVRYRVIGHVPEGHYVVMAKHQSQWETFYLQWAFFPIGIVLKQELLRLPFFGWGLRLVDPIAIDRGNPKAALRQVMQEGEASLRAGRRVLLFPEGTRTAPGQSGNYARSGAGLAINAGVPVVPVAHNAGQYWPPRQFLKYPGTVTVIIGKPVHSSGKNSRELTAEIRDWIEHNARAAEGSSDIGDDRETPHGVPGA